MTEVSGVPTVRVEIETDDGNVVVYEGRGTVHISHDIAASSSGLVWSTTGTSFSMPMNQTASTSGGTFWTTSGANTLYAPSVSGSSVAPYGGSWPEGSWSIEVVGVGDLEVREKKKEEDKEKMYKVGPDGGWEEVEV